MQRGVDRKIPVWKKHSKAPGFTKVVNSPEFQLSFPCFHVSKLESPKHLTLIINPIIHKFKTVLEKKTIKRVIVPNNKSLFLLYFFLFRKGQRGTSGKFDLYYMTLT